MQGHGFEQGAHFRGIGQALLGRTMRKESLSRKAPCQNLRAMPDSQALEECALGDHRRGVGRSGGLGQRPEIHMGGEVGLAWGVQRIGEGVPCDGLEGVSCEPPVAIVHHQRHATLLRDPATDLAHDGRQGGAGLDDIAVPRIAQPVI